WRCLGAGRLQRSRHGSRVHQPDLPGSGCPGAGFARDRRLQPGYRSARRADAQARRQRAADRLRALATAGRPAAGDLRDRLRPCLGAGDAGAAPGRQRNRRSRRQHRPATEVTTMYGLFVTGTDTGVGKTLAAQGLVLALRGQGLRVAPFKPVASGCRITAEGLRNEDAEALLAAAGGGFPYELVNPFAFAPVIAPHLAARQA